jgi:hypothetical protein
MVLMRRPLALKKTMSASQRTVNRVANPLETTLLLIVMFETKSPLSIEPYAAFNMS